MRLYLAVAVLMLAFVAYTEAQEDTIKQKLTGLGESISDLTKDLANRAKSTYDQVSNSELVNTSRNWIQQQLETIRQAYEKYTQ